MSSHQNINNLIETNLDQMTKLEKSIAQYFISLDNSTTDLSLEAMVQELHVSPSALTRFAKKCGFAGYREFVFAYQSNQRFLKNNFENIHRSLTKRVLVDYNEILGMTNNMVDENKLEEIARLIDQSKRVYFYGIGSSGLVAMETKSRFMRLGVICDAVTDDNNLLWTTNILDESCLVVGLSLSGQTEIVMDSLSKAAHKGVPTVLLTSQAFEHEDYDHTIQVASVRHLNYGNRISPQIPLLIMIDILYAYFLAIDKEKKENIFKHTIV
ncbi:MurR/RpiR family transcriptional regulator [Streptococcus oriscaviae]|uniref:MurR/RpiR family transcriptional regulator n=1 Tax=Streptococcus oriscaviae TaxID=2781599 RepID=A0ABX7YLV0_9STRE|nr:MurR/RpiR family transcriptional regulator [Streptococcus oriscaviae]QUE54189.1 MurR/RpiR family transcriptional regulator [Streptococcus oriscaviae]